jgi:hypothetical protein
VLVGHAAAIRASPAASCGRATGTPPGRTPLLHTHRSLRASFPEGVCRSAQDILTSERHRQRGAAAVAHGVLVYPPQRVLPSRPCFVGRALRRTARAASPRGWGPVNGQGRWASGALTPRPAGARPTREDALRWVHDNAMGDGSCAPLAAALAGDVLRTAAYTFWKAARKLRWVGKGVRTGGGPETRPQVAAGVARVAAAPTAEVAGLQPARDDGTEAQSGHQQPGAATRAL